MDYKSQAVQDVSVRIHSIKDDGTDNTGDVANLSTIILDPAGNELEGTTDYTEATFDEIDATGEYECLFSSAAGNKVFTSVDQANPYRVILVTSTADIGSSGKDINIVSRRIWELPTVAEIWANATRTLTSFGALVNDIWANVSRTLTDKTGFFISGTKTKLDDLNDLSIGDITGEIQNGVFANRITITGDAFSIVEKTAKTLRIDLGSEWDLTNKLVYFVMKRRNSGDAPIVDRLVDTIIDAVNGVADVDLLDTETTPKGCYDYQVELRNDPADDEPETAMEGTAEITENLRL
ncbi:hypothetical protein KAR91_32940 [Candidatus Pacearchaeota archaeon]|nr:hypothetical protein [Candidatus Pacearchaeota archaeon]